MTTFAPNVIADLNIDLSQEQWIALLINPWVELAIILLVSIVAMSDFYRRFLTSINSAPRLDEKKISETLPTVSVIIPAYNEAINIADCMTAVLANELPDPSVLQLIVADDDSTDETLKLAQKVADSDERAVVISAGARPSDEVWRGKNWACDRAVAKATGEYLLFIDADVRLSTNAIAQALANAKSYKTDLLSCAPLIVCGCFSEWIVQPLMSNLIAVGFDFEGVNDPQKSDTALAAGPFMLFRHEAYHQIGGHRAVADNPVEDLALASLIKRSGLKLRYVLGLQAATVRMYRSFSDLWEGWTKNYHLGSGRNIALTMISALAVLLIFTMPWAGLAASLVGILQGAAVLWVLWIAIAAVGLQVSLRYAAALLVGQPLRYWWLGWLGGLLVSAIAWASIIKTETGWGWTWRGRSLADNTAGGEALQTPSNL
ncbi:MAG: glycosyltransferase family 2 protein [Cyanobacteria bacterium J06632_3]